MSTTTSTVMLPRHTTTPLDWAALILAIVGGLNWGLVGLFNFDLVATLLGPGSIPTRAVYVLVGLAAVCLIAFAVRLASSMRT